MAFSKKPTQAPQFDASVLVATIDALSQKTLGKKFVSQFPSWKRWTEATTEYDTTGLRDVVNANAYAMDQLKDGHDALLQQEADLAKRVAALESRPSLPFPASG